MNEKQAEAMLKSIKRMEQLMEAIDWKLWNFHQKVMGEAPTEEVSTEEEETEQLAAIIEPKKASAPAEKKAGFPSVEKWS